MDYLAENPNTGISHVRATEIVRRLDLTSGAFYNIWESQEDYHDELLAEVLSPAAWPTIAEAIELVDELTEQGTDFDDIADAILHLAWTALADNRSRVALRVGLAASPDRKVRELVAAQYGSVIDRWCHLLEPVMEAHQRAAGPDLTLPELASATLAMLEGLLAQLTVNEHGTDDGFDPEALFVRSARRLISASLSTTDG